MRENQIIELIQTALSNYTYGVESFEFILEQLFDTSVGDFRIKAGKRNIAVIETKTTSQLTKALETFTTEYYFTFKIRFFVYTDGEVFYIYDRLNKPKTFVKVNTDGFVRKITSVIGKLLLAKLKSEAADIITKSIRQKSNQFPALYQYAANLRNKIVRELKLSSDYKLYFEGGKTDTDSFEHQLFLHLLDNNVPEEIYRYCPFARAFQILNDNTIAMQGLPGMNDTTEPNYVDNYLNSLDDEVWEMPPQSRAAINRRFIMSCTTLPDNLMQWRLYGDDGKGACLKLQTKQILKRSQKFYLGEVKYADDDGVHPELLLLKSIITEIRQSLFIDTKFILLYVWRHFFKPKEYEYEKEIRLLYIHQKADREKKWIIAEPYGIVNPMVTFDLSKNEFPLKVSEITLGPKKSEKQLNKSQLEQMCSEKERNTNISESSLKVYR